ncbi:MAG TPA: hypothetical protein VNZ45_01620 [Bacteroidia bacterium]|nr:hypothetical protein [Bacteroidia bacterium]
MIDVESYDKLTVVKLGNKVSINGIMTEDQIKLEAKPAPAKNKKLVTVTLSEPQKLNGSVRDKIELDFSGMKGATLRELVGAFNALYKEYVPVPTVDLRFQIIVAGFAAKMNPQDLEELEAPDYIKVCGVVRDFLTG